MGNKILLCCVLVLLMAAAADPLEVFAEGDPLASPTPQPTQRITAPVISGVNPGVTLPEEDLGDITSSGGFSFQDPLHTGGVAPPAFVDLQPVGLANLPVLPEGEISCGPAALSLALDILGKENNSQVPDAKDVEDFLREWGLMYSWGVGVEELVFAARSFGYPGTRAVHHWNPEALIRELQEGKPLVVPLGVNGPEQPGHFVILIGISTDRKWIHCSDPRLGKFRLSWEEFSILWELQGRTGVVLDENPLPVNTDPMLPWMGLLSTLSALGLVLNQTREQDQPGWYARLRKNLANSRRKGIGGGNGVSNDLSSGLVPRSGAGGTKPVVKNTIREVPIYETRRVQVGLRRVQRVVPVYETRQVQVGYKKEEYQVPTYKMVKVCCGTRLVHKRVPVTRYRIKKVWVWKKVTNPKPVTLRIGSKTITLRQGQTRWRWVQVNKMVPYQTTKIIKVRKPVYRYKRVQSGTRTVTRWVPRYIQKRFLAGYKTVEHTVPIYEEKRIQVGTTQVPCLDSADQLDATPPELEEDNGEGEEDTLEQGQTWEEMLAQSQQPMEDPATQLQKVIYPEISLEGEDGPTDSWLYKTILILQNLKTAIGKVAEKLGATRDPADPPHLFSLTTEGQAPLNILTEDGIQVNSFKPPHFLDLLYTRQELTIEPKILTTVNPDGLMDFNLTTKTWSMKLGQTTFFITQGGEYGFSFKVENLEPDFDYQQTKHSFLINLDGFTYKGILEGVIYDSKHSDDQLEVKAINTLQCKISTVRLDGVLVGVIIAALLAALFYFCASAGIPFPFPL